MTVVYQEYCQRNFLKMQSVVNIAAIILVLFLTSMISTTESKPISEKVYFYHYARDRPDTAIQLRTGVKLDTSINPNHPWKFFIHGFKGSPALSSGFHMGKAAYFKNGHYNIVYVDWSKPANQSYLLAVKNSMYAGNFFGKFLVGLSKNGVSLDDVHLLGYSLGSHMAGHTGKYVQEIAKKIGRITGLDPPRPFYEPTTLLNNTNNGVVSENLRLSSNDAKFVDIIHTDATHFGMVSSIGHCDFFPNGGQPNQPGCKNVHCSHSRSVTLYMESININNFIATECSSYKNFIEGLCKNGTTAVMGEHTDHNTRGIFYLKTNSLPPYGMGDFKFHN